MIPEELQVANDEDLNELRGILRSLAEDCSFTDYDTTKLVTAASEICRNILEYAGEGTVAIEALSEENPPRVHVTFTDEGPGIEDVGKALEDGYRGEKSTGLGIGLPGAQRLSSEFSIDSAPGDGTMVELSVRKEP